MSACKVPPFRVLVGLVFSLAALIVTSAPGEAVTLTNRDDRDHKVTVIEGETKTDHVLKPNQALEKICSKGCVVRLNDSDDDEYQLEIEDIVSIEDGYLYHDGSGSRARSRLRRELHRRPKNDSRATALQNICRTRSPFSSTRSAFFRFTALSFMRLRCRQMAAMAALYRNLTD